MKSSKPGAEKTATALMGSLPMLSTEIHVSAGINTVDPPCTTLTELPKWTLAIPVSKYRISSAPGCLWAGMAPPLRMSAVKKTKCEEPPFLGSTFKMKVSPDPGVRANLLRLDAHLRSFRGSEELLLGHSPPATFELVARRRLRTPRSRKPKWSGGQFA